MRRLVATPVTHCDLCGHSLKGNDHGFDQDDAIRNPKGNNPIYVHSGRCKYCKVCQVGSSERAREHSAESGGSR